MKFCYCCKLPILPWQIVWLGDEWGGKFPFHPRCADQAWPLFECEPPKEGDQVVSL